MGIKINMVIFIGLVDSFEFSKEYNNVIYVSVFVFRGYFARFHIKMKAWISIRTSIAEYSLGLEVLTTE